VSAKGLSAEIMAIPTPEQVAQELLLRMDAAGSLERFIEVSSPETRPAAHHRLLLQRLEAIDRGEITRLMIFMPPGTRSRPMPASCSRLGSLAAMLSGLSSAQVTPANWQKDSGDGYETLSVRPTFGVCLVLGCREIPPPPVGGKPSVVASTMLWALTPLSPGGELISESLTTL
jgi:hypothetical protein